MPAIIKQVPGMLSTIKQEHEWLKGIVANHKIDVVISDNRYGLHHDGVPSIIMTHQLQVQTGLGQTTDNIFRKLHYRYLEKFDECWVVDVAEAPGLAGSLSHTQKLPKKTGYIGLLSQQTPLSNTDNDYLLVLLSGPEPQRTILSDKIWAQLQDYKFPIVFVEGSNNIQPRNQIPEHITYHKQLTKDELSNVFRNAGMVICRSGYSTIMDLLRMGKKAILIPTPGQTEQEYLGRILQEHCMFICQEQSGFNLAKVIEQTRCFPFLTHHLEHHFDDYKAVVDKCLDKI
ncbi:MAG: glycosyl transferase [Chitinophagales bacterium]|nr:glycosyl transferase [Chitinophagales bacterium]